MQTEGTIKTENELYLRGFSIDWDKIDSDSYLHDIASIRNIDALRFHKPVTFFAGENGSGKSTLLEALAVACGFNPEGGTKNYSFSTYDSHSELCDAVRLIRGVKRARWGYFLRAESFYNVATAEEEYGRAPGAVPQQLHRQSHGESFLAVAQANFRGDGLYLLDEPEAALSPQRQLGLLMEIAACASKNAQFIIVTHSPILLGMPGAEIWNFDGAHIHSCEYEETDSYQLTEMFINHREELLKHLIV